jgi:hypothetical protein
VNGPTAWVVLDTRCGHEFGAAVNRSYLDTLLEVAAAALPEGVLSVHPVELKTATRIRAAKCQLCEERREALLIAVFRPALGKAALAAGANPIEVNDAYDGLLAAGRTPHEASQAVAVAIRHGAYRTPVDVPDADDPRWSE